MARLREIPRTATFAWSAAGQSLLVTGTRAGAVDADFSDETKLELWDLDLDNLNQVLELQPKASITTESRFYDIAWGPPNEDYPRGVIACALENGSLDIYDAARLLAGEEDALILHTTKHTGAIKSIQFNPNMPHVLASGGAKGELYIHDVENNSEPFRLGTAAARADDIECVAWNRKVSHILATGTAGGFVIVWDLKTKKNSYTLNNNRKPVSAIAWDPANATRILTATWDDISPYIFLWDFRNSNAPEKTLQGHVQGVLSLSWCQQDPNILISCGKDNRTIVWNPHSGEQYGEFPEMTNWTFLTRFSPANPNFSATASFDGKIIIQTLQNTNPTATENTAQGNLDGEDFFAKAQAQLQGASFTLTRAPAWYERPASVTCGYGGKLVILRQNKTAPGQPRSSMVEISRFSVDSDISAAAERFEREMAEGDMSTICQSRLESARTDEDRAAWKVMQTLNNDKARDQVTEYLGFSQTDDRTAEDSSKTPREENKPADEQLKTPAFKREHNKNRLSILFAADGKDEDDFLEKLAASKGAKTDNPFYLFNHGNSDADDQITKALVLGNFERAVEICIREGRMADAFIMANCGGKDLLDKVQAAYLSHKKGSPSYLRLLGSVVSKSLWDVVYNADLADWAETMVALCTFADSIEFPDLCEALGDRIQESGSRKNAAFCYLVGSKLEKIVPIWIAEFEEAEQASLQSDGDGSSFSIHAKALQNLIEKVTVFRHVICFSDADNDLASGWKLASLYNKYTEYAEVLAAHGHLGIAEKYLDFLPTNYPAAEIAKNRVRLASQKGSSQARSAQPTAQRGVASQGQPVAAYPASVGPGTAVPAPIGPYGQPAPGSNPYAPPPQAYQPSQTPSYGAGQAPGFTTPVAQLGGAYSPAPGYGQPSRYGAPPPAVASAQPVAPAAPPIRKSAGDWNDVPMVAKPPARRSTPRVAPITSPFPNQPSPHSPPPPGGFAGAGGGPPPVAPPPKGSAPPPRNNMSSPPVTSSAAAAGQQISRPPSTAASAYAPPPPPSQATRQAPPPMTARIASPYQAAPTGPPPSARRYTPAPSAAAQPPTHSAYAPVGSMQPPPPPSNNPYAPPQPAASNNPYAPPSATQPPPGPNPTGPPLMGGPPMRGPPPAAGGPPSEHRAAPPPPKAAAASKYPPGDRSHIPPQAQGLFEVLTRDMQRVAAKAPTSFAPQVKDTQKRLNLLFDALNNEEMVRPDTIARLTSLAQALETKDYDTAHRLQVEIAKEKTDECGQWMVGVKRLVVMSKATP